MAGEYKNNQQNNTSFIRQWLERCGNTSQDFHDDYHIDEIVDSLPKDKELWWDASVHIYNDFTRYIPFHTHPVNSFTCQLVRSF